MDQAQDLISADTPPYRVGCIAGMSGMYNTFDSVEVAIRRGLLTKDHAPQKGYTVYARPGAPCIYKPGMFTKVYEIIEEKTMICVCTISIQLWRCSSGATTKCIRHTEYPHLLGMIALRRHICPNLIPLLWSFIEEKLI